MKSSLFSSSSILKKFLIFNLIVFLVLGIFTYLYLSAIKPNLVKNRSTQHLKIINNTSGHINRLNIEFTKESATKFLLDARFLFQNLDRVQLYDLNLNLLADTDTLDLTQDIFVKNQEVQETSIDKSEKNINISETSKNISITINGDTTYEANETFKITLSNPTNNDGDAALGSNTVHTVTITNDDTTTTTTTVAPATTPVPTTTTPAPTTTTTAAPDTYYMGVTCWSDTALILKSPGSMGWGGASKTGTVVKTDGGGCYTLQGTGSTNDESWSGSGYTIVSVHADCAACLGQTTTTTEEPTTTTTTEAPEMGS